MDYEDDVIRSLERQIEDQIVQSQRLTAQLDGASVTAQSSRGEVTVTVNSSGALSDLALSEQAMRLGARELANLIVHTNQVAQARLADQVGQLVAQIYGPDSGTAGFVAGAYQQQFPPAPPPPAEERERGRNI